MDNLLWKHCFYGPINYYRKSYGGSQKNAIEGKWALTELERIIAAGLAFFITLIYELLALHGEGIAREGGLEGLWKDLAGIFKSMQIPLCPISQRQYDPLCSSNQEIFLVERVVPSLDLLLYGFLICCGDLGRYRCQFNRLFLTIDQYQMAWMFYYAALKLTPGDGRAPHQLSSVLRIRKEYFGAIFWYVRSEHCQLPFPLARNSLLSLCEWSMRQQSRQGEETGLSYCIENLILCLDRDPENLLTTATAVSNLLDRECQRKDKEVGCTLFILSSLGHFYPVHSEFIRENIILKIVSGFLAKLFTEIVDPILFVAIVYTLQMVDFQHENLSYGNAIRFLNSQSLLCMSDQIRIVLGDLKGYTLIESFLELILSISDGESIIIRLIADGLLKDLLIDAQGTIYHGSDFVVTANVDSPAAIPRELGDDSVPSPDSLDIAMAHAAEIDKIEAKSCTDASYLAKVHKENGEQIVFRGINI